MEEFVFCATLGTLAGFGVFVGERWARSNGQAVLLGLALTVAVAVALVCLTLVLVVVAPGTLDPRRMGFFLGATVLFGSAVGIVATLSGRRRAVKAAVRLF